MEDILHEVSAQIQFLQPSMKRGEDSYVQQPILSGIYSTKSGYFSVGYLLTKDENFHVVHYPTGASLTKWPRCQELETSIHIFLRFPFAQKVWQLKPLHQAVHVAANTDLKESMFLFRKAACFPCTGITTNDLRRVYWARKECKQIVSSSMNNET